jgi:hypothetical protein
MCSLKILSGDDVVDFYRHHQLLFTEFPSRYNFSVSFSHFYQLVVFKVVKSRFPTIRKAVVTTEWSVSRHEHTFVHADFDELVLIKTQRQSFMKKNGRVASKSLLFEVSII